MMASKSLEIILRHGLGDYAINHKQECVKLGFNIEEACREIDMELRRTTNERDEALGMIEKLVGALDHYVRPPPDMAKSEILFNAISALQSYEKWREGIKSNHSQSKFV